MTAVEWLQERINIGLTYEQEVLFEGLFEQAKEMEKEQIIESFSHGVINHHDAFKNENKFGNAEQYYHETFKSE